jgi:hypothetical protein
LFGKKHYFKLANNTNALEFSRIVAQKLSHNKKC